MAEGTRCLLRIPLANCQRQRLEELAHTLRGMRVYLHRHILDGAAVLTEEVGGGQGVTDASRP